MTYKPILANIVTFLTIQEINPNLKFILQAILAVIVQLGTHWINEKYKAKKRAKIRSLKDYYSAPKATHQQTKK